jgi:WYL_2, Sm-like SH3 beta-barrel fold
MVVDRDNLLQDLRKNVVEVHFIKVNGEERKMRCTLMAEHLPQNTDMKHLDEQHARAENKDVVAVWDIEKGGWRSFRVDSVTYVSDITQSY